jgi:hypothetical protein
MSKRWQSLAFRRDAGELRFASREEADAYADRRRPAARQ